MLRFLLLLGVLSMAAAPPLSAQPPQLVRDFWPGEVVNGLLNHGRPMAFRLHGDDLLLFANDGNGAAKLFRLNDLSGNVQELAHVGGPAGYTTTNGGIITSGDNIGLPLGAGGDFTTKLATKPKNQIYEKLSYEALNPRLCQTAVMGCLSSVGLVQFPMSKVQMSVLQYQHTK